jgi:NAD(P)-dependent dehydrogenase (short-subunit alcohol dehydrogenase family)
MAGIAAFARTWAMECARDRITVYALIPTAFTRMVATIPVLEELAQKVEAGEPIPAWARQQLGLGMPDDAAGLVVFLASAEAQGITGQCVGIGGDKLALWSHPAEVSIAYREGGWSADQIAEIWSTTLGQQEQSYGMPLPEPGQGG